MTDEKIKAAVEIAQKAIELSHRVPPEGLKKSKELMTLARAVVEMSAELAALKDKARWRKQSEEPAPKNQLVEVCESAKDGYIDSTYGFGVEDWAFWRPLDLPEESK